MITQSEIARKDFDRVCELNNYETFTEKQVMGLSGHIKSLIEKSNREALSPDEIHSIHAFNQDMPELKKAIVLNNDLTRETVYYRERQVIFEDNIEKSEDGEIMKARTGYYANTAQNRKAGRVGQKYGGKKAEGEDKKEDKDGGESNKDKAQFHREQMAISNKKGDGAKYHYHMGKRDMYEALAKKESKDKPEGKKEGNEKLKQGDKVTHPIHGEGILIDLEGDEGTWIKDVKGHVYSIADSRDLKKI